MNEPSEPASSGDKQQWALPHNLLLFGRILRELGLDVNPGDMIEIHGALPAVSIGRRSDFYHTLRTFLVKRKEDILLFDLAFDLFWRQGFESKENPDTRGLPGVAGPELESTMEPPCAAPPQPSIPREVATDEEESQAPGFPDTDERKSVPPTAPSRVMLESLPPLEETVMHDDRRCPEEAPLMAPVYSPTEILRQKDFDKLAPNELDAVHDMMAQIVWEWGERRTRRHVLEGAGLLDFRRSLRRNLRYGTEVLEWSFRAPKVKPRALVVIADISGSMQRYTRLVLQYLYGLKHGLPQRVEVFIFGTQLTRVTRQFAHRDIDKALREVTEAAQDWSGGTNIGGAIKTFNYRWARKVLSGGAVVLLISDGWDRGDPVLLSQEMARLRRLCHRLIWLNPLLGSESYEPLTRGMQAALPNIDDFLPAHNLASLEDLARHLHNISDRGAPGVPLRLTGPAFVGGRTDRRIRLTA